MIRQISEIKTAGSQENIVDNVSKKQEELMAVLKRQAEDNEQLQRKIQKVEEEKKQEISLM